MPQKLFTSPRYRKNAQALFLREKSIRAKNPTLATVGAAISADNRKVSEYAKQLREKQKVRRLYGVAERQFHHYFELGSKAENTAETILQLLERRLDNTIYRAGFGLTRAQSRQFVTHGLFTVNGHKVDVPSYTVRVGDVIKPRKTDIFSERDFETIPEWLTFNKKKFEASVASLPTRDAVDADINEQLIVEFYSR